MFLKRRAITKRPGISLLGFALGLAALCVACSSGSDAGIATTGEFTTDIRQAQEVLLPGDSVALSELTDFDWDTVYFFAQGTQRSVINETVGDDVYDSDLDERVLLLESGFMAVFTQDGRFVETAKVPESFTPSDPQLDQSSATLVKSADSFMTITSK